MNYMTVACVDSETLGNLEVLGLSDEKLYECRWLKVFTSAGKARKFVNNKNEKVEVWVIGADDMEAINLAAAIKKDRSDCVVCLVAFELSGSLKSRATSANIDSVLDREAFTERFEAKKLQAQKVREKIASLNFEHEKIETQEGKHKKAKSYLHDNTKNNNDEEEPKVKPASIFDQESSMGKGQKKNLRNSVENQIQADKSVAEGIDRERFLEVPNSVIGGSEKNAFIMPVLSSSGGTGKSSVAAMSAILSCAYGHNTLLIDADFQFGDMGTMLGSNQYISIEDVIENPGKITQIEQKGMMPAFLACPSRPELSEKIINVFPSVLDALSKRFDVIVLNTGSFWGELQAIMLEKSSKALFMVDQRPSSINSTKKALDLCGRCGIATTSIIFALNRCKKNSLYTSIDVSCALQGAGVAEIKDGGMEVEEYFANGEPVILLQSRNDFALSLWGLLEEILPKSKIGMEFEKKAKSSNEKRGWRLFKKRRA